jgi:hypothetical protein
MPQTYKFAISMPVTDTLARNRVMNVVHFQHILGSLVDTDLESMCADLVELWKVRYFTSNKEITCRAYDVDAVPNYPRAEVTINGGQAWTASWPREVALCLSFAGPRRGVKHERGRIYLCPAISSAFATLGVRPTTGQLDWALDFYDTSNASLPDIGGVDWQFGIWSGKYQRFTKAEQAWVNDDWDTQRRRGLRETTRVSSVREG